MSAMSGASSGGNSDDELRWLRRRSTLGLHWAARHAAPCAAPCCLPLAGARVLPLDRCRTPASPRSPPAAVASSHPCLGRLRQALLRPATDRCPGRDRYPSPDPRAAGQPPGGGAQEERGSAPSGCHSLEPRGSCPEPLTVRQRPGHRPPRSPGPPLRPCQQRLDGAPRDDRQARRPGSPAGACSRPPKRRLRQPCHDIDDVPFADRSRQVGAAEADAVEHVHPFAQRQLGVPAVACSRTRATDNPAMPSNGGSSPDAIEGHQLGQEYVIHRTCAGDEVERPASGARSRATGAAAEAAPASQPGTPRIGPGRGGSRPPRHDRRSARTAPRWRRTRHPGRSRPRSGQSPARDPRWSRTRPPGAPARPPAGRPRDRRHPAPRARPRW